jgi:hypothetical protein
MGREKSREDRPSENASFLVITAMAMSLNPLGGGFSRGKARTVAPSVAAAGDIGYSSSPVFAVRIHSYRGGQTRTPPHSKIRCFTIRTSLCLSLSLSLSRMMARCFFLSRAHPREVTDLSLVVVTCPWLVSERLVLCLADVAPEPSFQGQRAYAIRGRSMTRDDERRSTRRNGGGKWKSAKM